MVKKTPGYWSQLICSTICIFTSMTTCDVNGPLLIGSTQLLTNQCTYLLTLKSMELSNVL